MSEEVKKALEKAVGQKLDNIVKQCNYYNTKKLGADLKDILSFVFETMQKSFESLETSYKAEIASLKENMNSVTENDPEDVKWTIKKESAREIARTTNNLILKVSQENIDSDNYIPVTKDQVTEKMLKSIKSVPIGDDNKKFTLTKAGIKVSSLPDIKEKPQTKRFRICVTQPNSKNAIFSKIRSEPDKFNDWSFKNEVPQQLMRSNRYLESAAWKIRGFYKDKNIPVRTQIRVNHKNAEVEMYVSKKVNNTKPNWVPVITSGERNALFRHGLQDYDDAIQRIKDKPEEIAILISNELRDSVEEIMRR